MITKNYFDVVTYKEVGSSHLRHGRSCEDNVYSAFSEADGVRVITLSDGAGSYENAERGSEITSRIAAELLAERFEELYSLEADCTAKCILQAVNDSVSREAQSCGKDIESYSATLLCAAMHPDGRYLTFHVGDGVIVGYREGEGAETVSFYDHDGPVNQTTFVTVSDTEYNLVRGKGSYAAFILMSDGPEEFTVNESHVSPVVSSMMLMPFFIPKQVIKSQLMSLTEEMRSGGMTDDASYAIMWDCRETGRVYGDLTADMKKILFEMDSEHGSKKNAAVMRVLNVLSNNPDGVSASLLARRLYLHSPAVAKKKIAFMIDMALVEKVNGRYFIKK